MKFISLLFLVLCNFCAIGQNNLLERYKSLGSVYVFGIKNAPFPDSERKAGHIYDNINYDAATHYNDSSVLVFVPKDYKWSNRVDILIHFHGWNNHLDSVTANYKLIEQFAAAKKNALLIIPQGPKDAPDSYGGKLEKPDGFKKLVLEVLDSIARKENKARLKPNNIIISGHSGGYRVMSYILLQGGLTKNIKEVWLFDALYGNVEKFAVWMQQKDARLVNIYTKNGGTFSQSQELEYDLNGWKIPFWKGNESELSDESLKKNKILSVFTTLEHNETLNKTDLFRRLALCSKYFDN